MSAYSRAPGVDLLRALAIVAVMLYHASSNGIVVPVLAEHGWMGVDLFFVLSGYLIGWQVMRTYQAGATPRWGDFMLGRALRILPAYLAVLAFYMVLPAGREGGQLQPVWKFVTFTLNIFPEWQQGTSFSHAWSLCVEEHFYLLLPLATMLLARRSRAREVMALAGAIVVGGMVLRGWLWHTRVAPHLAAGDTGAAMLGFVTAIYDPTYTRLDGLLVGVMLAVVRAFRPGWWAGLMRNPWILMSAGLALLTWCTRIQPQSASGAIALFPLAALGCACLLAGVLSPAAPIGRRPLPGMELLATLAFSLYLTHKQVYAWLDGLLPGLVPDAPLAAMAIYFAASLVVAALLYLGVERPGLHLRARLQDATPAGATKPA